MRGGKQSRFDCKCPFSKALGIALFSGSRKKSMSDTQQIVNKAWSYAHVLRDDGLSYMAYTEQITFLLFLKMADEQTRPPYNRKPIVPPELGWPSLLARDGDDLEVHYRHILEQLGRQGGCWARYSRRPGRRFRTRRRFAG